MISPAIASPFGVRNTPTQEKIRPNTHKIQPTTGTQPRNRASRANTNPEEVYEGDWSLSANGEYSGVLTLDMTRTGGKRYKSGETDRLIHDSFIVQVPMLFEDYTCLAIDKGTHGSYLPIQMEPETVLYFYPQWTE